MFTGIVETLGRIAARDESAGLLRFGVESELAAGLATGASISVSGVCLTVTAVEGARFTVDVADETVRRSTLGDRRVGDLVNLERPLRADGRLDGHFVQGHVDARGEIARAVDRGADRVLRVSHPPESDRFIVEKGSIAVDGVSLTVTACGRGWFEVMLIPHTRAVTTLGAVVAGAGVNLEYDVLAKYLARWDDLRRDSRQS